MWRGLVWEGWGSRRLLIWHRRGIFEMSHSRPQPPHTIALNWNGSAAADTHLRADRDHLIMLRLTLNKLQVAAVSGWLGREGEALCAHLRRPEQRGHPRKSRLIYLFAFRKAGFAANLKRKTQTTTQVFFSFPVLKQNNHSRKREVQVFALIKTRGKNSQL